MMHTVRSVCAAVNYINSSLNLSACMLCEMMRQTPKTPDTHKLPSTPLASNLSASAGQQFAEWFRFLPQNPTVSTVLSIYMGIKSRWYRVGACLGGKVTEGELASSCESLWLFQLFVCSQSWMNLNWLLGMLWPFKLSFISEHNSYCNWSLCIWQHLHWKYMFLHMFVWISDIPPQTLLNTIRFWFQTAVYMSLFPLTHLISGSSYL